MACLPPAAPGLCQSARPSCPPCLTLSEFRHPSTACLLFETNVCTLPTRLCLCPPPAALPAAWAQAEGGCIMAGQQVIGTCEQERNAIASVFPLSTAEPVGAQQIDAAVAALKAVQGLPAQP